MTSGRSKETGAGMVLEDQATFSERRFLEHYHRPRNMGAECELCDVQGDGSHVSAIANSIYRAVRNSMKRFHGHRVLSELNQILLRQGSPAYATAALITFNTCDSRLCFSYA